MQILTAGVENPHEPAMIVAYLPWNETVEDEKRKQEVGNSGKPKPASPETCRLLHGEICGSADAVQGGANRRAAGCHRGRMLRTGDQRLALRTH
jgi:hypothetical protein